MEACDWPSHEPSEQGSNFPDLVFRRTSSANSGNRASSPTSIPPHPDLHPGPLLLIFLFPRPQGGNFPCQEPSRFVFQTLPAKSPHLSVSDKEKLRKNRTLVREEDRVRGWSQLTAQRRQVYKDSCYMFFIHLCTHFSIWPTHVHCMSRVPGMCCGCNVTRQMWQLSLKVCCQTKSYVQTVMKSAMTGIQGPCPGAFQPGLESDVKIENYCGCFSCVFAGVPLCSRYQSFVSSLGCKYLLPISSLSINLLQFLSYMFCIFMQLKCIYIFLYGQCCVCVFK